MVLQRSQRRLLFLLFLLCVHASVTLNCVAQSDVPEAVRLLLQEGDKEMSQGRAHYHTALGKYTEALQHDPQNTRALFSRAQLSSRMKRIDSALEDLEVLLQSSKGHIPGLQLRISLKLQQGELEDAALDTKLLATLYRQQRKPRKDVQDAEERAKQLHAQGEVLATLSDALDVDPMNPSRSKPSRAKLTKCVTILGQVIDRFSTDSVPLRLKRAACALSLRSSDTTVSADLKYVLRQEPQNLVAITYNALSMRYVGAFGSARKELQRCLSIDPESATCATLLKRIRAEEKGTEEVAKSLQNKEYAAALKAIELMAKAEPNAPYEGNLNRWRCEAHAGLRNVQEGIAACSAALSSGDHDEVELRIFLADLHLQNEDIPAAEAQIAVARDLQPSSEKVREMLVKIDNLKRNAGRKNYYKLLGVPKSASDQEIRRAYRKLAKEHHPDRLRSKDLSDKERQKADELFRNINEAKEVLLDSEKRAAYDRGEDPNNPHNAQAGGQSGPFYGQEFHFTPPTGGFPFSGGFPFAGGFPSGAGRRQTFYFQRG